MLCLSLHPAQVIDALSVTIIQHRKWIGLVGVSAGITLQANNPCSRFIQFSQPIYLNQSFSFCRTAQTAGYQLSLPMTA